MSRVLTGAFFFLFTVLSADVSAQQRIVVAPFSGPQGARVHAQVVENLLENGVQLIDWSEVEALTGRSRLTESDYSEVGRSLNVAAFVTGRVSRRRRSWTLRMSVRDGSTSERLGSGSVTGRNVSALRRAARTRAYERISS